MNIDEVGVMVFQGRETTWCAAEYNFDTGGIQYHLRSHIDELPAHKHEVFQTEAEAVAAMAEIAPLDEWRPCEINEE